MFSALIFFRCTDNTLWPKKHLKVTSSNQTIYLPVHVRFIKVVKLKFSQLKEQFVRPIKRLFVFVPTKTSGFVKDRNSYSIRIKVILFFLLLLKILTSLDFSPGDGDEPAVSPCIISFSVSSFIPQLFKSAPDYCSLLFVVSLFCDYLSIRFKGHKRLH